MNRYGRMRRAALAGACALPILLAGCSSLLPEQQAMKEIDPPQTGGQLPGAGGAAADAAAGSGSANPAEAAGKAADAGAGQDAGQDEAGQAASHLTVYVKDRGGYLAPVSLNAVLTADGEAGRKALELMVEGSSEAHLLPAGFTGILPKGTQVLSYKLDEQTKTAVVDFSQPFIDYNVQDERRMLEAVTWTLTELPGVERVRLLAQGEPLHEMPVGGFPLDEPLSRGMGINLEKQEGVPYSDTMPVTLYFSAISDENEPYYVPVTRLVKRSGDAARAALEQLIAGPLGEGRLNAVMTQDMKAGDITLEDGVVTVNLQDDSYHPGEQMPAEMLQAVVLSMTENTGASKVRIRMNSTDGVTDTEGVSYDSPVARPDHVNGLRL